MVSGDTERPAPEAVERLCERERNTANLNTTELLAFLGEAVESLRAALKAERDVPHNVTRVNNGGPSPSRKED